MTKINNSSFMAKPGEQEVIVTGLIEAPREKAWQAYTNPQLVPCWWGPENLTTRVDRMRVEPGGSWRFVQRDGSGQEYAFHGVYHEILPPSRLVYTFEYEGMPDHILLETVTFEDRQGKTRITDQTVFQSRQDRDGMLRTGMEKGAVETMDRFAALLKNMEDAEAGPRPWDIKGGELMISRELAAPRERVWQFLTDPEHVRCWWGPAEFSAPFIHIDLCVGSRYLFCRRGPDGRDYWNTGVYRKIVWPERIEATDSFADKKGSPVPASYYGMSDDYPGELYLTITLEERDGKTKLTVRQTGHPEGDPLEQARIGWNQSLDKLAESLRDG